MGICVLISLGPQEIARLRAVQAFRHASGFMQGCEILGIELRKTTTPFKHNLDIPINNAICPRGNIDFP